MTEYQPGVCNINQKGIEYRQNVANVTGVTGLLLLAAPVYFGVGGLLLTVVGVPVMFIAVLNYLQATNSFCVSHGMAGTQKANKGASEAERVTNQQAVSKDRTRSKSMIVKATKLTAAISVAIIAIAVAVISLTAELSF